jgi:hypothetical protein
VIARNVVRRFVEVTTVTDRISAVCDRLERAAEHLDEVKVVLRDYYASEPYEAQGKFDPSKATMSLQHQLTKQLPVRCHTLIGELLHDLRSALDHLACAFIRAAGSDSCEHTTFPLLSHPPTGGLTPSVGAPVSSAAEAVIDAAQPYKWGPNFGVHPLWRLHRLAIIDRHRHIATRGVSLDDMVLGGGDPLPAFTWTLRTETSNEWGAAIHLDTDTPGVQGTATLEVVIHETGPSPVGNVSLLQALVDAHEEVRTVVAAAKRLPEFA